MTAHRRILAVAATSAVLAIAGCSSGSDSGSSESGSTTESTGTESTGTSGSTTSGAVSGPLASLMGTLEAVLNPDSAELQGDKIVLTFSSGSSADAAVACGTAAAAGGADILVLKYPDGEVACADLQ